MEYLEELKNIVNNMDDLPYGEITRFGSNIDKRIVEEIKNYEKKIDELKLYYKTFGERFIRGGVSNRVLQVQAPTNEPEMITCKIDKIIFNCPIISSYRDALKYPGVPCCMRGVKDWYFIAFPELGQVLPVTEIEDMFNYKEGAEHTRINYNLFNNIDTVSLLNSKFAVIPYTTATWNIFGKIDRAKWIHYLNQINVCQVNQSNERSQRFAINSTNCISSTALEVRPEDMAFQWSVFAQLYFIMYLFRLSAKKEHFSI